MYTTSLGFGALLSMAIDSCMIGETYCDTAATSVVLPRRPGPVAGRRGAVSDGLPNGKRASATDRAARVRAFRSCHATDFAARTNCAHARANYRQECAGTEH